MRRFLALAAVLLLALGWALAASFPPAARDAGAAATGFSATRAFPDIEAVARAPHPVGSAEGDRVRAYLMARLRTLGGQVSEQAVPLSPKSLHRLSSWSGMPRADGVGHNVIGRFAGRDTTLPALLLMAHHDSVWGSAGAADDGLGVAAALEIARAILAQGTPQRDLILLFTDSEEIGLDGASTFFSRHDHAPKIGMVINMEARGAGGRATMFETGSGNGGQMALYARTVQRPSTNSLAVLVYDLMPNSTDYTIAKQRRIPGFNLAVLGRAWTYHSPLAQPATVERGSLQDMGEQGLALAAAMAFSSRLPERSGNAAFADILGRYTLVYPAGAGWAILLLSAALIALAMRRAREPLAPMGSAAVIVAAMLFHGALLLTTFNAISGSGGNYYDRLAALPRLEVVAALLCIALPAMSGMFRRASQTRLIAIAPALALMWASLLAGGPLVMIMALAVPAMATAWFLPRAPGDTPIPMDALAGGAILLLLAASLLVQLIQPTAGPLLQWPLLLAAIALMARALLPEGPALAVTILAGAAGIGQLLAQAHFIFLAVGADLPAAMAAILFAALPLLLPLWPERVPRQLPGLALAVALLLSLWVRLDPLAPSVPAYSLAKAHKTRD